MTIGADGRHSTVREKAGLEVIDLGAPRDALWLRLSRRPGDPGQSFGRIDAGRILAMIDLIGLELRARPVEDVLFELEGFAPAVSRSTAAKSGHSLAVINLNDVILRILPSEAFARPCPCKRDQTYGNRASKNLIAQDDGGTPAVRWAGR